MDFLHKENMSPLYFNKPLHQVFTVALSKLFHKQVNKFHKHRQDEKVNSIDKIVQRCMQRL